jgi:hypothetical protein
MFWAVIGGQFLGVPYILNIRLHLILTKVYTYGFQLNNQNKAEMPKRKMAKTQNQNEFF